MNLGQAEVKVAGGEYWEPIRGIKRIEDSCVTFNEAKRAFQ